MVSADDQTDAGENTPKHENSGKAENPEHLPFSPATGSPKHREASDDGAEGADRQSRDHLADAMFGLQKRIAAFAFISLIVSAVAMMFTGVQSYEAVTGAATASKVADAAQRLAQASQTQAEAANAAARSLSQQVAIATGQVRLAGDALIVTRKNVEVAQKQADALSATAAAEQESASRQLDNVQVTAFGVPSSDLTVGSRIVGTFTLTNSSPATITLNRVWSEFSFFPLTKGTPVGQMRAALDASPLNPATIRPGMIRSWNPQGPELTKQTADTLNTADIFALAVGMEWQDVEHRIHHSFACTMSVKSGSTRTMSACATPLDD